MNKMKVLAIKLTEDLSSIKVAYEKGDKLFIRNGGDKFIKGQRCQTSIYGLGKWGYRKVENPPEFRDAQEILDNISKFELKNNGIITYSG